MKPREGGEGVASDTTSGDLTYPNMTQDEPERVKVIALANSLGGEDEDLIMALVSRISVSEKRAEEMETTSRDWESAYMASLKFQAAIFEDMKRAISERDSSQASLLRVVEALKDMMAVSEMLTGSDNACAALYKALAKARTALSPHKET